MEEEREKQATINTGIVRALIISPIHALFVSPWAIVRQHMMPGDMAAARSPTPPPQMLVNLLANMIHRVGAPSHPHEYQVYTVAFQVHHGL
jgi:hypothetical protein